MDELDDLLRALARPPTARRAVGPPAYRVPEARFRFVRALGVGGMGSVDLVYDPRREQEVAFKRCHGLGLSGGTHTREETKRGWRRLKREFRLLADLQHPSLVSVYELGVDPRGVFFTMEVVDGVDFVTFCREGTGDEEAVLDRLATCLPSLLEGLGYLHAHGWVHRDLKPSNVLVDGEGRARILDFGLLATFGSDGAEVVGTPGYTSPEQERGAAPQPAFDLYALGVMLAEAATGRRPVRASSGVGWAGSVPSTATPTPLPAPLADVVRRLTDPDPSVRPSLDELGRTLLPRLGGRAVRLDPSRGEDHGLIGRDALVGRVEEALSSDDAFAMMVLEGASGVGKTAVAQAVSTRIARRGVVVLAGRVRPTELLPFNAIDGIVDALADRLATMDGADDPELRRHRRRGAVAFPALGEPVEVEGPRSRAVAFDGVARVLEWTAARGGGVLLWVDDLQWADEDSVAFLRSLVESAPRGVRVLATARDDVERGGSTFERTRSLGACVRVPALDAAAMATIVRRASGGSIAPDDAARLAAQCEGRAYLAEVAGRLARRNPGADLRAELSRDIARLPPASLRALAALAAHDGAIGLGPLARAVGMRVGELDAVVRALADHAIVRLAGTHEAVDRLAFYHDVAQVAAERSLGAAGLREGHAALAAYYDRVGDAPLRLVRHLAGAGRTADAAERAEAEASGAEQRQAYELAARLYELAGEGSPDRADTLRRARARALIRAGLYAQALGVLDAIHPRTPESEAAQAFDCAYAHFMSDAVDAGCDELDRALRAMRLRPLARGGWRMIPEGLRFVAGPPPSEAPQVSARGRAAIERSERDAEIALVLSWEEPIASVSWVHRVRALADRDGRPENGACAEYFLAFFAYADSPRLGAVPLAERYLAAARRRAGETRREPLLRTLDDVVVGFAELRQGLWEDAVATNRRAARTIEAAGGHRTHIHLLVLAHTCGSLLAGDRVERLARAVDELEAACAPTPGAVDAHSLVHRLAWSTIAGERSVVDECRERLAARRDVVETPRFSHLVAAVFDAYAELVFGDPIAARRLYAELLRPLRRAGLLRWYMTGCFASFLALAEAAALRLGDPGASARRIRRWAQMARRSPPLQNAGALRALAYLEDARDAPERAMGWLREAVAHAEALDSPRQASIARYQLGRRLGGEEGARLQARARADMRRWKLDPGVLEEDPGGR
ncbi:MAG TPA: serine/threonine-protein kinase [Sandaracinaceae bacterium LLY-WYZ-13_1]|nr:serine/threonine-protein kinase [Sandaracinaceae bacterium LLY-WYZ-13_1]